MEEIRIDKTLDIGGVTDIRAKAILMDIFEKIGKGQVLRVIAKGAAARQIIPSLCESSGYELLDFREDAGMMYFTIQK